MRLAMIMAEAFGSSLTGARYMLNFSTLAASMCCVGCVLGLFHKGARARERVPPELSWLSTRRPNSPDKRRAAGARAGSRGQAESPAPKRLSSGLQTRRSNYTMLLNQVSKMIIDQPAGAQHWPRSGGIFSQLQRLSPARVSGRRCGAAPPAPELRHAVRHGQRRAPFRSAAEEQP